MMLTPPPPLLLLLVKKYRDPARPIKSGRIHVSAFTDALTISLQEFPARMPVDSSSVQDWVWHRTHVPFRSLCVTSGKEKEAISASLSRFSLSTRFLTSDVSYKIYGYRDDARRENCAPCNRAISALGNSVLRARNPIAFPRFRRRKEKKKLRARETSLFSSYRRKKCIIFSSFHFDVSTCDFCVQIVRERLVDGRKCRNHEDREFRFAEKEIEFNS